MTDDKDAEAHPELVTFLEARSAFEARIVVAVLGDAGIPAYAPGGLLLDEFAMSQQLMNLQGVAVQVPADRLQEAQEALAAAKATGESMVDDVGDAATIGGESEVEPPPREPVQPGGGGGLAAKLGLGLLAALFAYLWLDTRAELAASGQSPLYDLSTTADGVEYRWKHNGKLAYVMIDRDRNLVNEITEIHNRDGVLVQRAYDADQNGMSERLESFGPSGRVGRIADDADQNGWYEAVRETLRDGVTLIWRDTDGDNLFDRIEVEKDGSVVVVQELRGIEGYVKVD